MPRSSSSPMMTGSASMGPWMTLRRVLFVMRWRLRRVDDFACSLRGMDSQIYDGFLQNFWGGGRLSLCWQSGAISQTPPFVSHHPPTPLCAIPTADGLRSLNTDNIRVLLSSNRSQNAYSATPPLPARNGAPQNQAPSKFSTLPLRPPWLASVLLAVPLDIQYLQLGAVARSTHAPSTRAHRPLLDAASWVSNNLRHIL